VLYSSECKIGETFGKLAVSLSWKYNHTTGPAIRSIDSDWVNPPERLIFKLIKYSGMQVHDPGIRMNRKMGLLR